MRKANLVRTREGRTLCSPHARTGAPMYHSPGCEACEAAREKGIIRPDVTTVPAKQVGRGRFRERFIDWRKVNAVRRAQGAA